MMSLLDDYNETNWDEYNKLGLEMEKNINQIEKICFEFSRGKQLMVACRNNRTRESVISEKEKLAVAAAFYWWILAVSYFQIHIFQNRQSQRLITYK